MPFQLDEFKFASNLRSARRGAAPGPSGMSAEHMRLVLDNVRDTNFLFLMAEQLARGRVQPSIADALRLGRMTALQKPNGGVRGIVAGDILVGGKDSRPANGQGGGGCHTTTPICHVYSGRVGVHSISRKAMLEALSACQEGRKSCLLSASSTAGLPCICGKTMKELSTEKGEGDALMPLLFSLAQHAALEAVKARMVDGEVLLAFLDDVYFITTPERVGDVYVALQEELYRHARIRIHVGKTQVEKAVGERPDACEVLERIAQAEDPSARVWKGSEGVTVLGTLGHVDYVEAQLTKKLAEHSVFLQRIPLLADVQSAWSLLLHCAGGRANYLLRVVRPELVETFAAGHNAGLWECLRRILRLDFDVDSTVKDISSLPLAVEGTRSPQRKPNQ